MKAKKSKAVTVIEILLVLLPLYFFITAILTLISPLWFPHGEFELIIEEVLEEEGADKVYVDQVKRQMLLSATTDFINSLFFMVVGVGILKRRNWARILLIFGCVSLFLLWTVGLRSDSVYFNVFRILFIALCISLIFFFTRPKVKDEFRYSPTVKVDTPVEDDQKQ